MKKNILIAVAFAAVIALSFTAFGAYTYSSNKNSFRHTEDGYGLYRYKSTSVQMTFDVPEAYEGKPVTELMAFSIANAEYLKEINISKNIKTIDIWALTNCPLLESINVDEENPYFCSVDGVLYNKDKTELLFYPNSKTALAKDEAGAVVGGGSLVLPDSVVSIRDNAFYLCSNLYSVTLNNGLKSIGSKAFLKCENLRSIEFPETVEEIGADAFSYCNSLKTVEIPSSVESIGDYAFFSTATKIEKIIIHRKSENDLKLGKDWLPYKLEKTAVEYVGE